MNRKLVSFPFDNTYIHLPNHFYAKVVPDRFPNPTLIQLNQNLAKQIGLDLEGLTPEELALIFSGQKISSEASPIALAYSGHQFGHFVPLLGDGRAALLGEVLGVDGKRYDVQLKGSGQTPFSRNGDGRSALGPVLREYILSEAMHRLGIPTTRALAAVETGEQVYRQEGFLPGGVFTRIALGHLRIGTFEYPASRGDIKGLQALADYAISRHYSNLKEEDDSYFLFFQEVGKAQISLVAKWMGLGFIHGVMNTDNTSISGETIDYGPCAFLDEFHSQKVFSSIDSQGRYAYGNQGAILLWNLSRLANCLIPLVNSDQKKAIKKLEKELESMQTLFEKTLLKHMGLKLGLSEMKENDQKLVDGWLDYLQKEKLDYTLSFRNLSKLLNDAVTDNFFNDTPNFRAFKLAWQERLKCENNTLKDIIKMMEEINPWIIPRNHQVERTISKAMEGDFSLFYRLNDVLSHPYKENPSFSEYALPPTAKEIVKETFCGT